MLNTLTVIGHFLVMALVLQRGQCDDSCRVPLGIKTPALPPDDRYTLEIENILGSRYVPEEKYIVVLKSNQVTNATNHQNTKFIAFSIFLMGDTVKNPDNPKKPLSLKPGMLLPQPDEGLTTSIGSECPNTIIQSDITPKSSVRVTWVAPGKGNGCVTIYAMVAIRTGMYYSGLNKLVCEDTRKLEDMPPEGNSNCRACVEARYKMIFEGLWSYNTHRPLYPTSNVSTPTFSDIVGASHNKNFNIFVSNMEASEGVQQVAEQGNTTKLEVDMQKEIGDSVRTIIKATRPRSTNGTTSAMFRVSPNHHVVSVVTAILPSPDWFLGASNLELCNKNQMWSPRVTYNLYPMDAGTDKGTDFNSANDKLIPAQPIGTVLFQNAPPDIKPFAKLHFELIRTFELTRSLICPNSVTTTTNEPEYPGTPQEGEDIVTTTSEAALVMDPDSTLECPMTAWSEWDECEASCEGGKRRGQHKRERYHIVNGVTVMYGDELWAQVPDACKAEKDIDFEICEEDCEESSTGLLICNPENWGPGWLNVFERAKTLPTQHQTSTDSPNKKQIREEIQSLAILKELKRGGAELLNDRLLLQGLP